MRISGRGVWRSLRVTLFLENITKFWVTIQVSDRASGVETRFLKG